MAARPSLAFVAVTVFLDVLGMGLIIPVIPALVGSLTATPSLQSWWYGALVISYGTMQFLCAPFLGALSDRFGRRPVLLLSIFGFAVAQTVTPLAHSLYLLLVVRLLAGVTSSSLTVATAYVADVTTPEDRSKGFGLLGAASGVGFIFGPMLGGLLGAHNIRLPFFVAAGMAFLNWLYGFFVLPESLPADKRSPITLDRVTPFGAMRHVAQLRGVGSLVVAGALVTLSGFIFQVGWVLYTTFRFGWGPRQNGAFLFLLGVTAALVQGLLLGTLLRRLGEKRLALLGIASSALVDLGIGLATESWLLYALILVNALSFTMGPVLQGLISRATDAGAQGVTQGALQSLGSVMIVAAPLIATPILALTARLPARDWRLGSLFFACALLQIVAFVIAARHFRKQPAPT